MTHQMTMPLPLWAGYCAAVLAPAIVLGLSQAMADTAATTEASCPSGPRDHGVVSAVIDGDTLSLADGRIVRLAGIEAPKPHLAQSGANVGALSEDARKALQRIADGAKVELRYGVQQQDRHGRLLAELFLESGTSLQEAMVAGGHARVRPLDGDLSCLGDLLAREREARKERRGMWQTAEFGVMRANDPSLINRKGLYVLVEGRVVSVGRGNRLDFLNFGRHWQRDFTVLVGASVGERLSERGLKVESFAGRHLLVRGVLEESGGPAIRLGDPGEIEFLDDG